MCPRIKSEKGKVGEHVVAGRAHVQVQQPRAQPQVRPGCPSHGGGRGEGGAAQAGPEQVTHGEIPPPFTETPVPVPRDQGEG